VICFEYADQVPDEFKVDWEKDAGQDPSGPIERVIEALGLSWGGGQDGSRADRTRLLHVI